MTQFRSAVRSDSGAPQRTWYRRGFMLCMLAMVLCTTLVPRLAQAQAQAGGPPIKLGVMLSFTGPAAISAATYWYGIRMGVKEINDAGGLLGRKIEIVQADDQFNPAQAVSEARRLAQLEKVNFVLGPGSSGLALAVAPIFNEAKIIYFSTSVAVIPTPYNFSPMMSTSAYVAPMVKYMRDVMKVKNVALLSDDGAASKATVQDFKRQLAAAGLNIVAEQEHGSRPTDITPQLLSLRRANPDVLIQSSSYGEDAGLVIKSMADIGWNVPVMSTAAGLAAGAALKIAGPDAFKSDRIFSTVPISHTYCANDKPGAGGYAQYIARLKAFDPQNFANIDEKSSLYLYDALQFIKAAVEATRSLDAPTLVAWMDQNGSKLHGTAGSTFAVAPGSHYMMGPDSIAIVRHPEQLRPADKLVERLNNC
jgi:ABC-type branched-subunit amino acid transport system substrate-binding protein